MTVALNVFLFLVLLILSPLSLADEQYIFTPLELKMDNIANSYVAEPLKKLEQLEILRHESANSSVAERALIKAYECSLRAGLTPKLAQQNLDKLKQLSQENQYNHSVRAATALCQSDIARQKNNGDYDIAIYKSFLFAQKSKLATLRYWVSLNTNSLFTRYNDMESSERALNIAFQVASDNNDIYRLNMSSFELVNTYNKLQQYELALANAIIAQDTIKKLDSQWYQDKIYVSHSTTLRNMKKYSESLAFSKKAVIKAKERGDVRESKFILLDIALIYLFQEELQPAKELVKEVLNYSTTFDDQYLLNQGKLLKSYIYLFEKQQKQSTMLFEEVVDYLERENYPIKQLDNWQQLIEIAALANNQQVVLKAQKQYSKLFKQRSAKEHAALVTLLTQVYESIRLDDATITQQKIIQTLEKKAQLEQNYHILILITLILGTLIALFAIKALWRNATIYKANQAEINRQLFYDPLTQCFNRRYFKDVIAKSLMSKDIEDGTSFLVAIDIDNFKSFNDTYGHAAGDVALQSMVNSLQSDLRANDRVVRFGGEEFLMVLSPNDSFKVEVVIERIMQLVRSTPIIIEDKPRNITISIGYVPVGKVNHTSELDALLKLADKALYLAKENGRNRAVGVYDLHCPASAVDNITIAHKNALLKLTEITPSYTKNSA